MGQCNRVLVFGVSIQRVRNDIGEDFGGDAVYRSKPVLQGSNQTEDLEGVLLKDIDLNHETGQPPSAR